MGYRLHARIPNVSEYNDELELGKQYVGWEDFKEKWLGDSCSCSLKGKEYLLEFYNDILETNKQIEKEYSKEDRYDLYNLDLLKEMIDYAIKYDYEISFESF